MTDTQLIPYLFFSGTCREAMEFYQNAFGGELTVQLMSDVPGDVPGKAERPNDVMHAMLKGGLVTLMASDSPDASAAAAKVELSLNGSDEATLRPVFDALADGGSVRTPLARQFWGAMFGTLTDKYGVDWMMNIETPS